MEVPAAQAGTVVSIGVEVGKTVNAGDVIGQVEVVSVRTTADTSVQRGSVAQPAAQVDKVDTGGVARATPPVSTLSTCAAGCATEPR